MIPLSIIAYIIAGICMAVYLHDCEKWHAGSSVFGGFFWPLFAGPVLYKYYHSTFKKDYQRTFGTTKKSKVRL